MTPIEWTRWIRPLEVRLYCQGFSGRKVHMRWDAKARAAKLARKSDLSGSRLEKRVWLDHLALHYLESANFILGLDKYSWWELPAPLEEWRCSN